MPNKLPVLERIARDILSALEGIRPESGYTNRFTVRRRGVRGNAPQATQIAKNNVHAVIMQPAPQKTADHSHDQTEWIQPFWIDLFVCPDEDATESLDSRINSARADCEKALCYDETSRTRGGLAVDTSVQAPIPFMEGAMHGIQCRVNVQYATVFNDPYTSPYSNIDN